MLFFLRFVFLGSFIFISVLPIYAKHIQGIKSVKNVEVVIRNMMIEVEKGDMGNLFNIVDQHWHLPSKQTQDLMKTSVEQRKKLDSDTILGVEMINKKTRGDSLIYFTFLEKYEHAPIYWLVVFYKPKEHWIIINISWAADMSEILKIEGNVFD